MHSLQDHGTRMQQIRPAIFVALLLTFIALPPAHAQTYEVIYNFTGSTGYNPPGGLTFDSAGNLYGTGSGGGAYGDGTVYELSHSGSGWTATVLHNFNWNPQQQMSDGTNPHAGVVFGPSDSLFGTTCCGGDPQGGGTAFELTPSGGSWNETILHAFTFGTDGGNPYASVVFDSSGNLYGTTGSGGTSNFGVVYELSPGNGGWQETVLWNFGATPGDGIGPGSNITFDFAGHIYGVTQSGGLYRNGAVYELKQYGSTWKERTLYSFQGTTDGESPLGALIADAAGNLYGTTTFGGSGNGGTVFELAPVGAEWQFHLLHSFQGPGQPSGPFAALVMDSTGVLYGTTYADALGVGNVFKLAPSGGNWVYTDLHDFSGNDGEYPTGNLVFDAEGNLYGTTEAGGTGTGCSATCGVAFEITP